MKPISPRFGISRRVLLSTLALLPAFPPSAAMAQHAPSAAFSFAAYGDSRPMMYLPYKEGQPELNQLFVEMFGLVMPEKIAEAPPASGSTITTTRSISPDRRLIAGDIAPSPRLARQRHSRTGGPVSNPLPIWRDHRSRPSGGHVAATNEEPSGFRRGRGAVTS